jgi:hypothetical protein
VGLEIELEYDDAPDGVWSRPGEAELRGRPWRRWGARPSPGGPLYLHLGIALAAVVLGAASTAGLLHGRAAQRDREVTRLHLAPLDPFVVQAVEYGPVGRTAQELLATPWTDSFDQDVTFSVVNDGPAPVTVLGATLAAPEFTETALTPRGAASVGPGGVSVLKGKVHIVCGDFPQASTAAAPPTQAATVADLRVRTSDGRIRHQSLLVDRYSDVVERAACERMPGPQVITGYSFRHSASPGRYTMKIDLANRAPYPLLVAMPSSAVTNWANTGGLDVRMPAPSVIAPHGTGSVTITVDITNCPYAVEIAHGGFAFDALNFTDARDDPADANTRQNLEDLSLDDPEMIEQYCGLQALGAGNGQ